MCACAAPRLVLGDHEVPAVRLAARRRSGASWMFGEVVRLRSRARVRVDAPGSAREPPAPAPRFELIDGSAVAGPVPTSRNADEQTRARGTRRGACRVRESRHAASRSPVDRLADGGVTGHKSGSLAASSDVCTANQCENVCKQPMIRLLRSPALCAGVRDISCRARPVLLGCDGRQLVRCSRSQARSLASLGLDGGALGRFSSSSPPSASLATTPGVGSDRLERRRRRWTVARDGPRRQVAVVQALARGDATRGSRRCCARLYWRATPTRSPCILGASSLARDARGNRRARARDACAIAASQPRPVRTSRTLA